MEPGPKAIGSWSGGRFMRFGEPIDDERLIALLRPDAGIDTVLSADTYGEGAADTLLGRALVGLDRGSYSLVGAIGHDFYDGERNGPKGFPRFTDPALRGPADYADYLLAAAERSLERIGVERFDLLLLHNPDQIGYTSRQVWDGMAALRERGLTDAIGLAPGPANGFSLDLIDCFERFGSEIDWAMIILNPLEPWPGELVLAAARRREVKLLTRVVDYGGLFWGDVRPGHRFAEHDHRKFRPVGWVEAGCEKLDQLAPIAAAHDLSAIQLACEWNLAQDPVRCVVPTLIEEIGDGPRSIEQKRAELAAIPGRLTAPDARGRLEPAEVTAIRAIGDNTGSMALKGANPAHHGPSAPDRWGLDAELAGLARRWGIDPERDLVQVDGR